MSTWSVVLLGLIALGSLVQTAFLIGLALAGRRLAKRVAEVQQGFTSELQPLMEDLKRVQQNLGEVSDRLAAQAERVETLVADTSDRIDAAREMVMPVASRVMAVAAAARAVKKGFRLYRTFRGRADS